MRRCPSQLRAPFAHGERAVEERDEPHAALQEPAGEQAVAAEGGHERIGVVQAVETFPPSVSNRIP